MSVSGDGGADRWWSVWVVGLGKRPRAAVWTLTSRGLLARTSVTALGQLRVPLPLRIAEGLSESAAGLLVEQGASAGAVLEARTYSRAAGFSWSGEVVAGLWDGEGGDGYTEAAPSDQLVASVEQELGFPLPDSYVALARIRNGGRLAEDRFRTARSNSWAADHIAVVGILAVGRTVPHSLCGPLGSPFMQEEWGYPRFGIGFADTPTGGHQQLMLDYRDLGADGEPRVVWVDQGADYDDFLLAESFEAFVCDLVGVNAVAPPADDDLDGMEVIP